VSSLPHDLPVSDSPSWDPRPAAIPFAQFRDEVLALYEPPLRAASTYATMRLVMKILSDMIGPEGTTHAISPALIAKFLASRPAGEGAFTTHTKLSYIRAACGYAESQRYLFSNPFSFRKKWLRIPRTMEKKRHHSLEDISRVLDLAKKDIALKVPGSWSQWRARRLHALVAITAYCGLRRNEVLHLRTEDIDLQGRMLLVRPRSGNRLKTEASAQPVPMPDALASILSEWLPYLQLPEGTTALPDAVQPRNNPDGIPDPGWVIPNSYRSGPWIGGSNGQKPLDRLKRLGKRAGVEGLTFLSLRHSWATHAESKWGFSEAFIMRVLRHTNPKTQGFYRHADPANLKAGVRGIGFGGEPAAAPEVSVDPPQAPFPPSETVTPPKPSRRRRSANPLDEADVAELRELRSRGWTYTALMKRYNVAKSTLHSAIHGLTHRNVPPADGSEV
jgi:integrase